MVLNGNVNYIDINKVGCIRLDSFTLIDGLSKGTLFCTYFEMACSNGMNTRLVPPGNTKG